MNSTQLFELGLGLQPPWEIRKIHLEDTEKDIGELHIHLDFKKGSRFLDKQGQSCKVHDTVTRKWQHLNFFQHQCFLHARVPRIIDSNGKVTTVPVPWAREGSGFTLLFEAFGMMLIESEMPIRKASSLLKIFPQRLWTIFNYWVSRAHKKDRVSGVKAIGIDETSSRKGHNYVTTMADIQQRRILYVTPGKTGDCIKACADYLDSKGNQAKAVKQICIDMSPAYISGCRTAFPDASVTFDKFHVMKELNKAMDELRKHESRKIRELVGHKYTFLKNRLSYDQQTHREFLLAAYPQLGEGYRLKELFSEFWNVTNKEEAGAFLLFWCDQAKESGIAAFKGAAKTITNHMDGILEYVESRITNGIVEGLNAKIQLAKRRARGYRNIDNFINMIYLTCGKLEFDYPLRFI